MDEEDATKQPNFISYIRGVNPWKLRGF